MVTSLRHSAATLLMSSHTQPGDSIEPMAVRQSSLARGKDLASIYNDRNVVPGVAGARLPFRVRQIDAGDQQKK
jgi:hypothetical protein